MTQVTPINYDKSKDRAAKGSALIRLILSTLLFGVWTAKWQGEVNKLVAELDDDLKDKLNDNAKGY